MSVKLALNGNFWIGPMPYLCTCVVAMAMPGTLTASALNCNSLEIPVEVLANALGVGISTKNLLTGRTPVSPIYDLNS